MALKYLAQSSSCGCSDVEEEEVKYLLTQGRKLVRSLIKVPVIFLQVIRAGIAFLKFNNENTRATYEIYSKLTIKVTGH